MEVRQADHRGPHVGHAAGLWGHGDEAKVPQVVDDEDVAAVEAAARGIAGVVSCVKSRERDTFAFSKRKSL